MFSPSKLRTACGDKQPIRMGKRDLQTKYGWGKITGFNLPMVRRSRAYALSRTFRSAGGESVKNDEHKNVTLFFMFPFFTLSIDDRTLDV